MILDTSALSAFVDGDAAVGEALRHQARACIPAIVLGEFRYGIAKSRHRAAYERWRFAIASLRRSARDRRDISYAALRLTLEQNGTPIPANDAWIAALALQHRLTVLRRDRHFDAAPQIKRRNW